MNSDNMKMQAAIGLFILSAIVITMLMVLYMTGGVRLGGDAYLVVVTIDNIGDLKTGAPAKFGGVEIGKVKKISIEDKGIQIIAGINGQYSLQADTTARIATSGLVGDAFLEFTAGKSSAQLKRANDIADAARVPGTSQSGMGDMLVQIQKIGGQVEELVNNINALLGKKEFRDNIEQSVANVNQVTAEVKSLLVDFHDNLDQVDKAVENIVKITGNAELTMKNIDGFVTKTMGDKQLAEDIVGAVHHLSGITKVIDENKESIGSTMRHVSAATGNIAGITGGIRPGSGLLRLLSDEQAGVEVMAVISSLQRAARCLATVGFSDLIADKLVGDKIAEKWLAAHGRDSAAEMAYQWKAWMTEQKAYSDSLSRQSVYSGLPAYSVDYSATALPVDGETAAPGTVRRSAAPMPAGEWAAYESFYPENSPAPAPFSASPRVEVTPSAAERHPLEGLYRGK